MSQVIYLRHYIVFDSVNTIYSFETKEKMDEWLVEGIELVNEYNGKINKCLCNENIFGYDIVNVRKKK